MADAAPPAQQDVIQQLGEGWISVQQPGQPLFYVHQPSNTTQWEAPLFGGSPDPVKALAAALIAKYSLTDNRTATAAAGRLVRGGVATLDQFEARVPTAQLDQLGLKKGDEKKIALKRLEAQVAHERAQAEAGRSAPLARTQQVGAITVSVKGVDIAAAWTEAVVNAANERSFTEGDAGVSGVLRNACSEVGRAGWFADACNQPKTWLADDGTEQCGLVVDETQAALQPAGGRLSRCGVRWVIHAVGPQWTQYTEQQCQDFQGPHFKHVTTMIWRTIQRCLTIAAHKGCRSIIIPAISGGIFTHQGWGAPGLADTEQAKAREVLAGAALEWARGPGVGSSVTEIVLVDHPDPSIGRLDLVERGFDVCNSPGWAPPPEQERPPAPAAIQFTVTRDYQAQPGQPQLTVKAGEVLSSGTEAKYEQNGWRRVWRPAGPGSMKEEGFVPVAHLSLGCPAGAVSVPEGQPPPVYAEDGPTPAEPEPADARPAPAAGGAPAARRPVPPPPRGSLCERLMSYQIPQSGARGYDEAMTRAAAEQQKGQDAMGLFDKCTLTDLETKHGFLKGHLKQIAKNSQVHMARPDAAQYSPR